jgi:LPS export ABC transporter protein LptC
MNRFTAFILIIFFSLSCSEEKVQPQVEHSVTIGEIPSNESWNSKTTFTDEGKIRAVLFSNHLKMFEKQKITLLDGVKIDFYDKEQKKKSFLTSLRGKVDDVTQNMYAIDSVVAKNDSGVVLRTNELMWRNKDEKITSDKFVRITSPKEIIEGYGFESDQHLDNYVIFNVTYSSTSSGNQKK